jgi:hypothetical protein
MERNHQCKTKIKALAKSHTSLKPIQHWSVTRRNPCVREIIANLVNLLCGNVPALVLSAVIDNDTEYVCRVCGESLLDVGEHFVMNCSATNLERNTMWDKLMVAFLYKACAIFTT